MLRQTVEFEGREISLHQDAYIDRVDDDYVYTASGHDIKTGEWVRVVWAVENPDAESEDACDWDCPESVNRLDDDCGYCVDPVCRCYICGEYELYEHGVDAGEEFMCCGCIDAEDTDLACKIHNGRAEMTEENRRVLTEAVNAR